MLQNWFRATGGFRYSLKTQAVRQRQPGPAALPHQGAGRTRRLLRAVRDGLRGDGAHPADPGPGRRGLPRSPTRAPRPASGSTRRTTCTPGRSCTSRARAGCGSSPPRAPARRPPPSYTHEAVRKATDPKSNQTQGGKVARPRARARPPSSRATRRRRRPRRPGSDIPWTWLLLGLGVLVVLVALALVPRSVRRSRRTPAAGRRGRGRLGRAPRQRVDLGVSWPAGRSPHETGHHLAGWFGPEPDGPPPVRPPRGRGLAPGAEDALDRIVLTLERVRYARDPQRRARRAGRGRGDLHRGAGAREHALGAAPRDVAAALAVRRTASGCGAGRARP